MTYKAFVIASCHELHTRTSCTCIPIKVRRVHVTPFCTPTLGIRFLPTSHNNVQFRPIIMFNSEEILVMYGGPFRLRTRWQPVRGYLLGCSVLGTQFVCQSPGYLRIHNEAYDLLIDSKWSRGPTRPAWASLRIRIVPLYPLTIVYGCRYWILCRFNTAPLSLTLPAVQWFGPWHARRDVVEVAIGGTRGRVLIGHHIHVAFDLARLQW